MELVVLGSCGVYPSKGRACSGYLFRSGKTALLADCGTGVFSNLQRWHAPHLIDAVFISHFHPDHFLDFYPFLQYLRFNPAAQGVSLKLLIPQEGEDKLFSLLGEGAKKNFNHYFQVDYLVEKEIELGDFKLSFHQTNHPIPTFGLVVSEGGSRVVYTADTLPYPDMLNWVQGADLLIAESTYLEKEEEPSTFPHLSASEAGEMASEAGVKQLLLTHFWPETKRELYKAKARKVFSGEVIIATEHLKLEV
jgi:ribonuclease BN (tRNA processing enzyme)